MIAFAWQIPVNTKENENVWEAYTGLGCDWNQFGLGVEYPFELQTEAQTDYFMVKGKKS